MSDLQPAESSSQPVGLIMVLEDLAHLRRVPLPAGFRFRGFREGDELSWARIETSAGEFASVDGALKRFEQEFGGHRQELKRRVLFVENPSAEAVGTAMAWYGILQHGTVWGRLHWVGVHRAYQRRGIGRAMVCRVLEMLSLMHGQVYLTTQRRSLAAIRIYLELGFRPFLSEDAQGPEWDLVFGQLDVPHPG